MENIRIRGDLAIGGTLSVSKWSHPARKNDQSTMLTLWRAAIVNNHCLIWVRTTEYPSESCILGDFEMVVLGVFMNLTSIISVMVD